MFPLNIGVNTAAPHGACRHVSILRIETVARRHRHGGGCQMESSAVRCDGKWKAFPGGTVLGI